MQGIDKVYVLHCKSGYEDRDLSIQTQFARHGINFEYILDWDVSDLTEEETRRFAPCLTRTSVSVCMKHFEAMRKTVSLGFTNCLVFEDDIFLFRDFILKIEQIALEASKLAGPYVIYLSNSCNKYTPRSRRTPNRHLYENDHSRAADAYLISADACQKRLTWLESHSVALPIDHLYTAIDREIGIKQYWAENPVCEQGSMSGLFPSAIDNHYSLFVQRFRWQLDKFYKMHILRNLR